MRYFFQRDGDKLVFNLGPAASSPLTLGAEMLGVSSNVPFKEAKEQLLATSGLSTKHLHDLMKKIELASIEPDE